MANVQACEIFERVRAVSRESLGWSLETPRFMTRFRLLSCGQSAAIKLKLHNICKFVKLHACRLSVRTQMVVALKFDFSKIEIVLDRCKYIPGLTKSSVHRVITLNTFLQRYDIYLT